MTYLEGIDVSKYQGDITHALKGCSFAFAKVSQSDFLDNSYPAHLADIEAEGIVSGGYHFLDPSPSGAEQAALFLAHVSTAELLVCDVEGKALKHLKVARDFIAYVKAHDPRPILLYSSRGTWPGDLGQDANWVADYVGNPNRPGGSPRIRWAFWQWTSSPIDRDRYASTLEDLYAFAGRTQPATGDPMTNLVPLTAHRVLDLAAGTVLEKTPGGQKYTTLAEPVTLGLLGATSTHYHVADGDAGVYVNRTGLTPRTADLNVGA